MAPLPMFGMSPTVPSPAGRTPWDYCTRCGHPAQQSTLTGRCTEPVHRDGCPHAGLPGRDVRYGCTCTTFRYCDCECTPTTGRGPF